ncbi:hypothetical protein QR680_009641 [Steinernema hermaphroditum]|uniref:Uncharacterized protein n=1 Tax=Steinernema hermaphroditum TaxID=289476 RepID=A0AA39INL0_9BILA|nr:hypothetical protein QR680_009641 [Steinernema hermaphroditum]
MLKIKLHTRYYKKTEAREAQHPSAAAAQKRASGDSARRIRHSSRVVSLEKCQSLWFLFAAFGSAPCRRPCDCSHRRYT